MANTISINILANTAQLVKGMGKAQKSVNKAMSNMTKVVGVFASIWVSGKLVGNINKTLSAIDKIGKTSSKLGIATDALSGLHFAAEQSGVSIETFNMAIQRSTRRIAEAAQGTGEAVGALKELGLSAENLNQLAPDKQLYAIADAMESLEGQSDKVRLAMKLFDSEGVSLVNMLQNGSKELKAYAKDAESLGVVITSSMVKGVEAANDSMNRLNTAARGVSTQISVNLAPYIKYASDFLVILVQQLKNSSGTMSAFDSIISVVAISFVASFQAMSLAVGGFSASYLYLKTAILNATGQTAKAMEVWAEFHNVLDSNEEKFRALALTIQGQSPVMKQFIIDINNIKKGFKDATLATGKLSDSLKATQAPMKEIETTVVSGITGGFRSMLDGADDWGKSFQNILKDVVAQLIKVLVVQKAVNAITGAFGGGGGGATASPSASIPARAIGGTVQAGTTYMVGEQGRELFTPSTNGTISSNASTDSGASGTVVNVINNTNSEIDIQDNAGQIDIIINKISSDISRGTGSIGSAMEHRYGLQKV